MEYLLEFFDFFKKNDKNKKTWKDKVESIKNSFNRYKSSEYKKHIYIESNVKDNYFSLSVIDDKTDENLLFNKIDDCYEVFDYKDKVEITESDYKYAKDIAQEISDFLDKKSEKEFNLSNTTINDDGTINFNEFDMALDQLGYDLYRIFNKYLNKSFEFELKYYLWSSTSENQEVVERKNLKINDIKVKYGGNRFYMNIYTKGVMDENCSIWIESDTKSEYLDMEKNKFISDSIKMDIIKEPISRKSKRESIPEYPSIINYELSPSKYNTIEFISDMTELLTLINDEMKNNDNFKK